MLLPETPNATEFDYYFNVDCEPACDPMECRDWADDACYQSIPWNGTVDTDDVIDCGCDCPTLSKDIVTNDGTCYGIHCFMLCDEPEENCDGENSCAGTTLFYYVNVINVNVSASAVARGHCNEGVTIGEGCVWLLSKTGIDGDDGSEDRASRLHSFFPVH